MWSKVTNLKLIAAFAVSVAMLGVLACGGAEEETAPAAATAPAPAAPASAPAAPAPVAPVAAPAPAMEETPLLAGNYAGSDYVKFNIPVTTPKTFNEAPMLAALVKDGKLPPVEERLPDEPLVLPPVGAVGTYGGTWRRVYTNAGDHAFVSTDGLGSWDGDGFTMMPRLAKSWVQSDDGRTLTITLRKGTKWSDGDDFDTEDFSFAWNEMILNKDLNGNVPSQFRSPVTQNAAKFEVLDDVTFRYTWDDPNFAFVENSSGMRGGAFTNRAGNKWFVPSHYAKQFHIDFADKAALDKMMKEEEAENWVGVLKSKMNGYLRPELPTMNAWRVIDGSDGSEWIAERNPYYYAVDTAGNQLPYIDTMHLALVENLEAVSLKTVSGEIDFQGRHMTVQKIPLYRDNAVAGKYGLTMWPCPCANDAMLHINSGYDKDPVIGKLLRTRDFRGALSMAVDREEINEIFFLGLGEPKPWVPKKGTLYYPGDDVAALYATRDVARANQLLDGIGLTKKNADGMRMRPDGAGPLVLHFVLNESYVADFGAVVELMQKHWAEIGIGVTYKTGKNLHTLINNNEEYFFMWTNGAGSVNPWNQPHFAIPFYPGMRQAIMIGRWYDSKGAKGEDPRSEKYREPNPLTGGEYPWARILELWDEGKTYPMTHPRRIEIGKEIFKIHAEEQFEIGTVGSTPLNKGLFIDKNNFKGVPPKTISGTAYHDQGPRPELYYFEGGLNDAGF